jgi:hypothetical protein
MSWHVAGRIDGAALVTDGETITSFGETDHREY